LPFEKDGGSTPAPSHPKRLLLAAFRLVNGPLGEDTGKVLLVLRACPQIAGGVEPVRSMLGCLFRLGAFLQRLLDGGRPDGRRADVGEAYAPVTVDLLGRHPDDRPVEQPAAELDVLVW